MPKRRSTPPRLASWLLRLRPLGERRLDVTADLLELFQQRVQQTVAAIRRAPARLHEDMAGIQVVGIVSDAYTARLREYQASAVYQPIRPRSIVPPQLVIRATRPAESLRAVLDVLPCHRP